MDKQQNSKPKNNNNIFKMFPKAMSFGQRLAPFSPGRDLHHHQTTSAAATAGNRTFISGPIGRLVPVEARVRTTKNDGVLDEPTSPKVSCIGQIKLAKTKCSEKKKIRASPAKTKTTNTSSSHSKEEVKARPSMIKRMFSSAGVKTPRKSHPTAVSVSVANAGDFPSLGQMKKFASSRDAFSGFDWTVEMNREESPAEERRQDYFSDEETRVIAFSAPLTLNDAYDLKPKKEINLWKRRTMNPPKPLQIKGS